MLRKPPNAEEKQGAEQRLVAVQNRQSGATVNREDQECGPEETIPKPRMRLRKFGGLREGRIDQDNTHDAGQTKKPGIEHGR